MAEPERGEIWIADFGRVADAAGTELMKVRPALVVSGVRGRWTGREFVLVVPASTSNIDLDAHFALPTGEGGFEQPSYLACEEVRTFSIDLLDFERGPVGSVSQETLERVDRHVDRILEER